MRRVLIIAYAAVADVGAFLRSYRRKSPRPRRAAIRFKGRRRSGAIPADVLILAVHTSDVANWEEQRLTKEVCARLGLPITEIVVDRGGPLAAVSAE